MNNKVEQSTYTFSMSEEEEARWLCLIEGVNYISDKLEKLTGQEIDYNDNKVARVIYKALTKYIDERFAAMLWDVHVARNRT